MKNNSPWIHQLNKERVIEHLKKDIESDVAVVGGGIAGISTAFFILRDTLKSVTLLEGGRLGHGATGHNAGQVTNYFERSFHELVEEFGLEKASAGQRSIELAWELMGQMYTEANLDIPFSRFTGFAGFSTFEQIIAVLKNNVLRSRGGLDVRPLLIANNIESKDSIPAEYEGFYVLVPQTEILDKLETTNADFIALAESQKGVVNSALFTERVAEYLLKKYPDRFFLYEQTHINKVVLHKEYAMLDAETHTVKAWKVVLCTNGFDRIKIFDASGLEIDTRFHHSIHGVVGRMSGYLEDMAKPPMAISYYMGVQASFDDMDDPYFYLTRRAYEYNDNKHNLTCLGGPQQMIPDRAEYHPEFDYPEEIEKTTDAFLHKLYNIDPTKNVEYLFTWHGLMGYTPNGVRLVGEEPKNPVLLYNLGCNGVGILPSIFGGDRIAKLIKGEKLTASIFDPQDR
ncbi:MAG: FAD-binding oxidoreductase [bacterium]|nr:FAD-binding oxidoreductase [bacterium]